MVITDLAQFELLVQEVRDQILSESQGVGEVDIVDNLDNIYSLPALKLNDNGDQVVEAPLSLLSAPAEEAAATANAAAQAANTAAESANSAASSANSATDKTNEAISNAQSATQQAESSADKANIAAQNADEATAQVLSGESERVEAENARQVAEAERQSAEEERKSAEEARKLAEQSREEAEASRISAEESRVTAESERVTAESNRVQAEAERVLKESERESAESTRQLNEITRQSNEDIRVQLEQIRLTNEELRVSAESSRETEYTDLKQRADALIDDNEAAIENANTAAENANAAIANMENTYAKKDEIPDVSEFITISVDNLINYYLKSDTYSQDQINALIGSITTINFSVVDTLPETGENNLIYLVPSDKQEENNIKDEYIWIDSNWELIGSTKIDLSNYYTKDEVNSTFALKTELAWDTITGKPVWIGSSKPTYVWSEINEKPTTLAGYGITDAFTKTESDGRYPLKDGTGASGTWGISISGNAGSADKLKTPRTIWGQSFDGTNSISGNMTNVGEVRFNTNNPMMRFADGNSFIHNNGTATYINARAGALVLGVRGTSIDFYSGYDGVNSYSVGRWTLADGLNVKNAITVDNNTVWHEGNDGTGSGLNADLLDGVQYQNILEREFSKTNVISAIGWYRIVKTKRKNGGGISFKLFLSRSYTNNDPESYCFDITINYNTNIASITQTSGYANYRCIPKIRVTSGDNDCAYVDIYYSVTSENSVLWTTIGCAESIDVESNAEALTYTTEFETTNGCKSSLGFVGELTGNAATATKLQTPRTIWGRSFDGTENVSGDMTEVGIIRFSNDTFRIENGGSIISSSGSDSIFWGVKNQSGAYAIRVTAYSGTTYIKNLGINNTSPSYTLDVSGTFYASGAATLGSTLSVAGDLTVNGTIIDNASSDIRLKNILEQVDYQEKLLSLGDVVDFNYKDTAFSRENSSNLEHRSYTGLIYQNVKEVLPSMAYEDNDGYGYLNYLSHDYINLIAGALQLTITKLKQLEKRISILEEENIDLKQQLSN